MIDQRVKFVVGEKLRRLGDAEMCGGIAAPHHASVARRPVVDEIAGGRDGKTQAFCFTEIGKQTHRLSLSTTEHAGNTPRTATIALWTLSFWASRECRGPTFNKTEIWPPREPAGSCRSRC